MFSFNQFLSQAGEGVDLLQHSNASDVLLNDHSEDREHSQAAVLELPQLHPLPRLLPGGLEPEGVEAEVTAHGALLLLPVAVHLDGEDGEDDLDESQRALLVHLQDRHEQPGQEV